MIDPIVLYLIFGLVGIFGLYGSEWKNEPLHSFRKINYFAIFSFGLAYFIFYSLEKINYPNYVFSTYHIHPTQLTVPLVLSLYSYIISSKNILLVYLKKTEILHKWFPIIVIMLWILFQNFIDSGSYAAREILFMIRNPKASYDRKMEEKIGKQFYDYVLFIKENSPQDSKILIPPFQTGLWEQTGNVPYMTYFLYPRTLLNGKESISSYDLQKEKIDYVLVVWEEFPTSPGSYDGWPKFEIKAEKVVYMVSPTENKEEKGDYIYKQNGNKEAWGIIKVKK
jgi:hypothetical protein